MISVKDFLINDVSINIIEANDGIVLHIENMGKDIVTAVEGTRYVSVKYGILTLYDAFPLDMKDNSLGQKILSFSFINVGLAFGTADSKMVFQDQDRIDLHLLNIADIILVRDRGKWYVQECNEKYKLEEYLNSRIEHFEVLEDKVGILIQNMSVAIEDDKNLKLNCEVLSSSEKGLLCDISLNVAAYDKNNKIIGFTNDFIYQSDFIGFQIVHFSYFTIDTSIYEINRIVFYPNKR